MNIRSSKSVVRFSQPFSMPGYPGNLPAGDYEVLAEEELLQGLSFEAYRRVATYMLIHDRRGRVELRRITREDLDRAVSRDRAITEKTKDGDAALSPLEDFK